MSWLSRHSQGSHGNYEFAPHRGHYHEAHNPMTKDSDTPSLHERIQQLEAELNHLLEAQPQTHPGSELRQPASNVQATRLQYAMEASRDGLWDWDLQTGVVYCNHNYLRLIGYGDRESSFPLKTFLTGFVLPEDAPKAQEAVTQATDAGV